MGTGTGMGKWDRYWRAPGKGEGGIGWTGALRTFCANHRDRIIIESPGCGGRRGGT